MSVPPPPQSYTNTHTHRHTQIHTAPWNLLQDQMAGNACPPSPAEPWCVLWWLRLLFKPSGGSFTHTHSHTHTHTDTHILLVSPAHPPPAFTPQTAGQQENTHTHTKEQTDAVTLEMQAKRCRGEKFSLKLENSLFISAFGLQEEFCLFVRFFVSL